MIFIKTTSLEPNSFFWSADCGSQEVQPEHCNFWEETHKITSQSPQDRNFMCSTVFVNPMLSKSNISCKNVLCKAAIVKPTVVNLMLPSCLCVLDLSVLLVTHLYPVKLIKQLSSACSLFLHWLKLKLGFLWERFLRHTSWRLPTTNLIGAHFWRKNLWSTPRANYLMMWKHSIFNLIKY